MSVLVRNRKLTNVERDSSSLRRVFRSGTVRRFPCFVSARCADLTTHSRHFSQQENPSGATTGNVQFPWRHVQHIPPRLEFLESKRRKGDWRAKLFLSGWEKSTGIMMDIPWYHLVGSAWRQDIAEPAAWAFSRGVAGLLSNIYKVPMDEIYSNDEDGEYEVNFVYISSDSQETSGGRPDNTNTEVHKNNIVSPGDVQDVNNDNNDKSLGEQSSETTDEKSSTTKEMFESSETTDEKSSTTGGEDTTIHCDEVKEMFEEKVYKHFKDAHAKLHSTNSPPLEITLKMKPIDCELWIIGCFPFLNRRAVEDDAGLKKEYYNMLEISKVYGVRVFFEHFWAFADKMLAERGTMETTIFADVIVDCIEVFQVKDLTNNTIVQGDGKERTVRHGVRMELDIGIVVDENDEHYTYKGNWRIADFDDIFDNREWAL